MLEDTIKDLTAAIRENTEVTRQALASRGTPAPVKTEEPAPAEKPKATPAKKQVKPAPEPEKEPAPALSVVTVADEDLPDPEVDLDAPEATEEQIREAFRSALANAGENAPTVKAAYAKAIIDAGGLKDGKPYLPNVPAGNHGKLLAQFTAAIA